jgi:hypothetical protein
MPELLFAIAFIIDHCKLITRSVREAIQLLIVNICNRLASDTWPSRLRDRVLTLMRIGGSNDA